MSRPKFHTLKVKEIRRETKDCVSVAFDVPAELADVYQFIPGQYLTLRATINGEDMRRSYSICSAPFENELRVAVKEVSDGIFSKWVNHELKAGKEIQVMTPAGNFIPAISPDHKKRYLLIAAGSGITPVISIVKSLLHAETQSEMTLVYGNRFFNSIIFREQLEDLKDKYLGRLRIFHVLSGEPNEIPAFHGRIDATKMELLCRTFIDITQTDEIFICGPEEMIHSARSFAELRGIKKENIHFELFTTPTSSRLEQKVVVPKKEDVKGKFCEVSVIFDGQQTDFNMSYDGIPVLEAAQQQGLDIPFSCKGGMCCTCRAKVIEGEVEMEVNYALEPGEVEAGFVLTCQSHPRSSKLVINYDANN